jgi:WD40 repeat protein
LPRQSFVWDVLNPNAPIAALDGPAPLHCLAFNPKQPDSMLLGGCSNGLVCVFDVRAGGGCRSSSVESSHRDPVTSLAWTASKSHTAAVTCSTDGAVLFWDVRKLGLPTDRVLLATPGGTNGGTNVHREGSPSPSPSPSSSSNGWLGACGGAVLGASCLSYSAEAGAAKVSVKPRSSNPHARREAAVHGA